MTQVLVLGAGIVGICCALSLRRRGYAVKLLDRSPPASETSYGNAGVIAQSAIHPLADPALIPQLPRLMMNRDTRFRLEYPDLPRLTPWLGRFSSNMNQRDFHRCSNAIADISVDAVSRHRDLMREAGVEHLLNPTGWLKLYRTTAALAAVSEKEADFLEHGVRCQIVGPEEIKTLEPDLLCEPVGGLWMNDSHSVTSPAALAQGYLELLLESGGRFQQASLEHIDRGNGEWRVTTDSGMESSTHVVVALGSWSNQLLEPLGCSLPIAQERGYHMMFNPLQGAKLNRSIADPVSGFVMTPMDGGIRVTTGCNLAARERAPNPVQLEVLLPLIRQTFPLSDELLDNPWMGRRTSTPDSLPIIGELAGLSGLHVATGHCHLGLTLAPVTGELIANGIDGKPNTLGKPFLPSRF